VTVGSSWFGAIAAGLLVLVGVEQGGRSADVNTWPEKFASCASFEDEGAAHESIVQDVAGSVLVRLAVHARRRLPERRVRRSTMRRRHRLPGRCTRTSCANCSRRSDVATGEFQAMMQVSIVNDGPVTLLLDSANDSDR